MSADPHSDVHVRPLEPADLDRVAEMLSRLSPVSRYRRFFTPMPRLPVSIVRQMADVDHDRHEAIAAVVGDEIVGIAEYIRSRHHPDEAEIAVTVEDDWQRRGLARLLTRALGRAAAERGIDRFTADLLAENRPALSMVHRLAPRATVTPAGPELRVLIPLRRRPRVPGSAPAAATAREPACPMQLVPWPGAA